MTVVLLANVGNSDLLIDRKLLPPREDSWTPREQGEEVLANFERYRASIQLPLIGHALEFVRQWSDPDVQLILFASSQNAVLVDRDEYLKDSGPSAEVIKRFLKESKNPPRPIHVKTISGNPADYANALHFMQTSLQEVARNIPAGARIVAEVSGGTPAMTAMLMVQSVEVFGQEVVTLYVDRGSASAREVDVARSLFARKTRDTLSAQLRVHAYAAALQTVSDSGRLLIGDEARRELVQHLVAYADRRLAFDFRRARQELQQARALGDLQAHITHWQRELIEGKRQKNLEELIHSATIKVRQGEYADFTQRLFRFQEESLREIAERLGDLQYGDEPRFLSRSWLGKQTDLLKYAQTYRRHTDGEIRSEPQTSGGADLSRTLNRFNLGTLADYYIDGTGNAGLRQVADKIFRFSRVADLRNKGVAGHGFDGIGQEDLEAAYGAGEDVLIENLRQIYEALYGSPPAEDPYIAINTLILSLIEDAP